MKEKLLPKVVLDTNVLISALVYGGKPEQVYNFIFDKRIRAVISPILAAELADTLIKKFTFDQVRVKQLEKIMKKHFTLVYPKITLRAVLGDEDDNRVLEAAVEGQCQFIISGDRDLLDLATFKRIRILTPTQFLNLIKPQ